MEDEVEDSVIEDVIGIVEIGLGASKEDIRNALNENGHIETLIKLLKGGEAGCAFFIKDNTADIELLSHAGK